MTTLLRLAFAALSRLWPALAGRLAFYLFRMPQKPSLTPDQLKLEARAAYLLTTAEARQVAFQGRRIAGYFFAAKSPKGTVVLLHGWMSGARFMMAFTRPLLRAGFNVLTLDLPAHGASSGWATTGLDSAGAFHAVANAFADRIGAGGIIGIIAHSFGGGVGAFAVQTPSPLIDLSRGGVALVAVPNELGSITRDFADAIDLNAPAAARFDELVSAELGHAMADLTGVNLYRKTDADFLVLHSRDDDEVLFDQAEQYLSLGGKARLSALDGLGHRHIVYSLKTVWLVVAFMKRQTTAAPAPARELTNA